MRLTIQDAIVHTIVLVSLIIFVYSLYRQSSDVRAEEEEKD